MLTKKLTASVMTMALGAMALANDASACDRKGHYYVTYRPTYAVQTVVTPAPVVQTTHVTSYTTLKPVVEAQVTVIERRASVSAGASLKLASSFLGREPGVVFLHVGDTVLNCEIREWTPNSVSLTLPKMGIKSPTPAELDIRLPNGAVNKTVKIELVQPAEIVVLDETISAPVSSSIPVTLTGPQANSVGLPFAGQ